jgi:branched-chain amino acid transport system substrate-binding protein
MKSARLVGLFAAATLLAAGTSANAQITVGVAGPMTGQYASFGEQLKNGATLALEDINAAGGVNGQQLKLSVGDDACDPKQARRPARAGRVRSLLLVVVHSGVGSLCGRQRAADFAGLHQSDLYRTQALEHVPGLRT